MASLYSLYRQKEAGLLEDRTCFKAVIDSEFLLRRLSKGQVLKGHSGCVNTIAWNGSGTRLLSGSDDCHLNIYSAGSGLVYKRVQTSHRSNIFSARFLPSSSDLRTVSCAGIGSVEYSEFTPDGGYVGHPFNCHNSITYQVATTPSDPNEFFTCEDRGNVRLFDLRVRSSCNCDGCKKDVLYSFPASVTSIAVHPLSPFYVAFALGDGSVRLVDRRMTQDLIGKIDVSDLSDKGTIRRYKPYSIGTQPHKITSVQFNSVGSELLVSYSEDYVYLFNSHLFHVGSLRDRGNTVDSSAFITRPVYLSQLECYSPKHTRKRSSSVKRKPLSNYLHSPPTSSKSDAKGENVPPPKKLRLRGDWSDTGPEARPEADAEEGTRESGQLMNRMSRMFARWIDMSLNPSSENESSDREEVPGRYRRRRVPPPTSDGARSPTATSSSSSSDDSFQLFDSDSNEHIEEGRRGREGGEREGEQNPARDQEKDKASDSNKFQDHTVTLDSVNDVLPTAVDTSNGSLCATKSEGVATMDLATSNDSPRTTTQATSDSISVRDKDDASLSHDKRESASERLCSDEGIDDVAYNKESRLVKADASENGTHNSSSMATPRTKCTPLSSKEPNENSYEKDSEHTSGSRGQTDGTSITEDSDHIHHDQIDSVESNVEVTIENRTKKHSPADSPAVVIEGETDSDDCEGDGSCDSCTIESNDKEVLLTSQYFMRYKGHRNSRTMIKQANFWGENWVLSGSDCGRVFMWDKWTGRVVNMLMADSHVVNCVQPHPHAYVLATSGIDYDIKLWEPLSAEACSLTNLQEVVDRNEVMLQESRNTITVPSMFVFRILAYLQRRRRMQQSQDGPAGEESD